MDTRKEPQRIAVSLFRCRKGLLRCCCEAPCAKAHQAFSAAFIATSKESTHPDSIQYRQEPDDAA